ncbi:3-deoxy-7-phosphoheptulonate synthase [Enterobacteriaceae endosymbiont of Plateumaris consimilis]|uniref:3-deoxy-7-phosphoheptulonate synthase n=1 Tax=Enterobacteriaceae endosymbiont of Plateumaris consimilis TaxID=2675794 RepID=UPI001449FA56|nr:3-deoxy-7-phosphoheptulonate synthase [Enterobacteriaceae endosymbiont of Plateumaris consimilis]QJC28780.1 3-deoxy-7-phosphoheptulonate synthase [Enterobacteriaceae endosymbiont of Plateumaris consimilis]
MQNNISNNFTKEENLITPKELKKKLPITENIKKQILFSRQVICNIINKKDSRILIICGPCSIHNIKETLEYAKLLKKISLELNKTIYIVMRVYFEKPRTIIGWKGLINDPYMNNSYNINKGLYIARKLLLKLNEMGIPLATEILDPNTPQYLSELFSWSAIGARTTESQIHRELASSLEMPLGFKNNTNGNITTAINAIKAASISHNFISSNQEGLVCIIKTSGNQNCHIILRGGKKTNYHEKDIKECNNNLIKAGLQSNIMIDCSHNNSNKNFKRQTIVVDSIISQIQKGDNSIIGIMLESYINEGNQLMNINNYNKLKYGISITDGCISWETTENILHKIYNKLNKILPLRFL